MLYPILFSIIETSSASSISYVSEYDVDGLTATNPQAGELVKSYLFNQTHVFSAAVAVHTEGIAENTTATLTVWNSTNSSAFDSTIDEYGYAGFAFILPYSSEGYWYGVETGGVSTPQRKIDIDSTSFRKLEVGKISWITPVTEVTSFPFTVKAEANVSAIVNATLTLVSNQSINIITAEIDNQSLNFTLDDIVGGKYNASIAVQTGEGLVISEVREFNIYTGEKIDPAKYEVTFAMYVSRISPTQMKVLNAVLKRETIEGTPGEEIEFDLYSDPLVNVYFFRITMNESMDETISLTAYNEDNESIYFEEKTVHFEAGEAKEVNFVVSKDSGNISYVRIRGPNEEYTLETTYEIYDATLPDAITTSLGGTLALPLPPPLPPIAVGVTGGYEVVINYKSGELGIVSYVGGVVGPRVAVSGQLDAGVIWNLPQIKDLEKGISISAGGEAAMVKGLNLAVSFGERGTKGPVAAKGGLSIGGGGGVYLAPIKYSMLANWNIPSDKLLEKCLTTSVDLRYVALCNLLALQNPEIWGRFTQFVTSNPGGDHPDDFAGILGNTIESSEVEWTIYKRFSLKKNLSLAAEYAEYKLLVMDYENALPSGNQTYLNNLEYRIWDKYIYLENNKEQLWEELENVSDIAILAHGFYAGTLSLVEDLNEVAYFEDVNLENLQRYKILIIPSGGLYGLESSPTFRNKLEDFVSKGGTIIALAQQNGYEYAALPGELTGFGWFEDQSCQHGSVAMDGYHPVLSGYGSTTLSIQVDGYFTNWPENATILLTRTKNEMPAMLTYEHGNGTVIATTAYIDWGYVTGHSSGGNNLLRDAISFAKSEGEVESYAPEKEANISVNVTNGMNSATSGILFTIIGPEKDAVGNITVNVSIGAGESVVVNFSKELPSKLGIYTIDYSLLNSTGDAIQANYGVKYFAVSMFGGNITNLVPQGSNLTFDVTTLQEDYVRGSEVPFTIHIWNKGDEERHISCLGMVRNVSPQGYDSFSYNVKIGKSWTWFGVSFYDNDTGAYLGSARKGLFSYYPSVEIGVEAGKEEYYKGEQLIGVVNAHNRQSGVYNTSVSIRMLSLDNQLIGAIDKSVVLGGYGSGQINFTIQLPLDVAAGNYLVSAEATAGGRQVGYGSSYVRVAETGVLVVIKRPDVMTPNSENSILVNATNNGRLNESLNLTLSLIDADNLEIWNDSKNFSILINETKNFTFTTQLPEAKFGTYKIVSRLNGKTSTILYIPCSIQFSLNFNQSFYRVRDSLGINLSLSNDGDFLENLSLNMEISDMSFSNSTNFNLNPGGKEEILYDVGIPVTLVNGKYLVKVTARLNNSIVEDYSFFIPDSELSLGLGKAGYSKGEDVAVSLKNVGGVDTNYSYGMKFYDPHNSPFGEDSRSGVIRAGQSIQFNHSILEKAMSGSYLLIADVRDGKTENVVSMQKTLEVTGLEAGIESVLDKLVYSLQEIIGLITEIQNNDGELENAEVEWKAVSPTSSASIPIKVYTGEFPRKDYRVERVINFTQAIEDLGVPGSWKENSVKLMETDSRGDSLGEVTHNLTKLNQDSALLEWVMNGTTPENTYRHYQIRFDIDK